MAAPSPNSSQQPAPPPTSSTPNSHPAVDNRAQTNAFFDSPPDTQPATELPMSAPPPSPAGYPPPPAHAKQPLDDPPPAQQSTAASPPPPPNNLPPGVIALIIIVPVLAALLTVLYWRRKVHRRTHLYASRISQPDPHNPNAPHRPGAPRFIIPPGGTGADRPEGQRRADRMWRLMNGINRRPSRSDSVRTVPQYSADPQDTEMTLARAQRGTDPQPSFIMRFIGSHTTTTTTTTARAPPTTNAHPAEPPPNYESSTRTPAQSSSTLPAGPSSAQLPPLQPLPALGASFDTQTEQEEEEEEDQQRLRPQHHTLHLDRSVSSTSSSASSSEDAGHKHAQRPSRAALIPPPPPPPQLPRLTLPSHGPTPQQLSFLGSVATLASLGLPRPPDPHPDTSAPPPAFEAHPSANTLPR